MADDNDDVFEVDFRLDANGRTALNDEATVVPDYSTKICRATLERLLPVVLSTNTADGPAKEDPSAIASTNEQLFKELLFDCEIADSGLMPRTFWLAASDTPRCTLEQFAADIFEHHTATLEKGSFDPTRSGAEWWIQIRPSPEKAGRYAMHGDLTDLNEQQGVCFHWDKDEELRTICGGATYVHPHWSTVTYLTGIGAPTLILEGCRVDNLTGAWKDDGADAKQAVLSWPDQWKHLSFDGRWLHAVPGDLASKPARPDQRRYTFLVNVWLNHVPYDTKLFPTTMLDKLSGHEGSAKASFRTRLRLRLGDEEPIIRSILNPGDVSSSRRPWPMGDPGETVTVQLPNDVTHPSQGNLTNATTYMYRWSTGVDGIVLNRPEVPNAKRPRTADGNGNLSVPPLSEL
jgi:hypothetical protein